MYRYNNFSFKIKDVIHGDEYYTPKNVVDMIVPYVKESEYRRIWCPFDTKDSEYVKTFKNLGYDVVYGHIDTGQDFFDYSEPQGDIVISNPPFSKREDILEHLFGMGVPFALVMNLNGLFDSKKRFNLFKRYGCELLIPSGRMRFIHNEHGEMNAPNFQSVYVCNGLLKEQIVFSDATFYGERRRSV